LLGVVANQHPYRKRHDNAEQDTHRGFPLIGKSGLQALTSVFEVIAYTGAFIGVRGGASYAEILLPQSGISITSRVFFGNLLGFRLALNFFQTKGPCS
jgi:hypothetical protein